MGLIEMSSLVRRCSVYISREQLHRAHRQYLRQGRCTAVDAVRLLYPIITNLRVIPGVNTSCNPSSPQYLRYALKQHLCVVCNYHRTTIQRCIEDRRMVSSLAFHVPSPEIHLLFFFLSKRLKNAAGLPCVGVCVKLANTTAVHPIAPSREVLQTQHDPRQPKIRHLQVLSCRPLTGDLSCVSEGLQVLDETEGDTERREREQRETARTGAKNIHVARRAKKKPSG